MAISGAWVAEVDFVSLGTRRPSGELVHTPVWICRVDDRLCVWTQADSGKVRRVRRDPRAEVRPCSRRGHVATDAPRLDVRVSVHEDRAFVARVEDALRTKYGLEHRVVGVVERLLRRKRARRVVLVLEP
ncbi:PPOX class F420-dependent oxidoreductase [Phycicoccus sp. 3266]|uniref:PPOX class F420-dependent oxidoreductase n=1 Tax=Phycicoccus sp. 3266 TaxID=2817751 RepID=UPI00285F6806|nr:PPOX class F420-dependent oxidoreductase [Phycicoccus sp. 3266]MDR6864079.1 PPOX class probable F420-dependent enzyme [Phycicoccus sp. 3266]